MTAMSWTRRLPLLAAAAAALAATVAVVGTAAPAAAAPPASAHPPPGSAGGVAAAAAARAAATAGTTATGAATAAAAAAAAAAREAGAAPTAARLHVTPEGRVWVSPTMWGDFLAKAEAALRAAAFPDGEVAAKVGTLRATPSYGHSGWIYFDSIAAWEALGEALARAMRGADGRTGRSGWCAQQAAACEPWWNFSGCISRTYCCCPLYCYTVFKDFGPLTVGAGVAGGVHACCVVSFC
ncbi:hypothetical protein I4F81_011893 [Pyropia yezoensis]|uniref:Uncharacterized protein n=1 Tax=Pyropia yezoensis TaxID=2788 RepID=A0ACC3CGW9_PYRYE|nr:hypothetical protein I4F81_011893 [Neopyropia yezoensis]